MFEDDKGSPSCVRNWPFATYCSGRGEPPPRPEVSAPSKATAAPIQVGVTAPLRLLHGAPVNRLIDVNLIDPDHSGIAPQTNDFSALNPGYVPVRAGA